MDINDFWKCKGRVSDAIISAVLTQLPIEQGRPFGMLLFHFGMVAMK